jgi:hypothetical protein
MAAKFCVQHGLLPLAAAEAWVAANGRAAAATARSPAKRPSGIVRKPATASKPRSTGKKKKRAASESEESEASSDSDAPLAKRAAPKPKPTKKRTPPSSTAKKAAPKASRDVAFGDGGLDAGGSSSDDDVPLSARAAKA